MNANQQSVAILGNGVVGVALAKGFADLGYRVVFGTRDVGGGKTRDALAAVQGSRAASFAEAAKSAHLAVVALPWSGLQSGLTAAGAEPLAGKLVIDASNPLDFTGGAPTLTVGFTDSAGETVQRLLPRSKVVKAFNTVPAAYMVRPKLPDGTPDLFIAGNDGAAKDEVARVARGFGWRTPVDLGDITASRLLEPLAMVFITYAVRNNYWTHALSMLNQKPPAA